MCLPADRTDRGAKHPQITCVCLLSVEFVLFVSYLCVVSYFVYVMLQCLNILREDQMLCAREVRKWGLGWIVGGWMRSTAEHTRALARNMLCGYLAFAPQGCAWTQRRTVWAATQTFLGTCPIEVYHLGGTSCLKLLV